ncbi:MAG: GYD domain-containing protein [candidate division WOR-3 bacterium]
MPYYLLLTRLTDEGRKTLKENPERLKEVNREVEAMGAKIVSQYALLGSYDFLNIVSAPSNEVIAKISVELGSRGTLEITTFPAIPIDEFLQSWR